MSSISKVLSAGLILGILPAFGVIIKDPSLTAYYQIPDSVTNPFNGIGAIDNGYCTGFAISRNVVLTAAHCVQTNKATNPSAQVTFWLPDTNPTVISAQNFTTNSIQVNPWFDIDQPEKGYDIALLHFDGAAILPNSVNVYPLYDQAIAAPTTFELFGRGSCGDAKTGFANCTDNVDLHRAANRYDKLLNGNVLLYDFTENDQPVGCPATSALCYLYPGVYGSKSALGGTQGIHIFGDSGGPSLIQVNGSYFSVGIHSFVGCATDNCAGGPDYDHAGPNGTFGEYAGDTYLHSLSYFVTTGENVPEPAAWMTAAAGLTALCLRRRRIRL